MAVSEPRMAPNRQFFLAIQILVLAAPAPRLLAQVVDSIPPDPVCSECRLEVCGRITLGQEHGLGFVDWPSAASRSSESYFIVNRSAPSEIRVFDSLGGFVRVVGRTGEGPGEYREIWDLQVSAGDTLHVIDLGNLRRTVLSPDLTVARTTRLLSRPQKKGFVSLPDGGFLLNALYPASNGDVKIFHRMDVAGRRVLSFSDFGNRTGLSTATPDFSWRIPALSEDQKLFLSAVDGFSVEEWNLDGENLRVMVPFGHGWERSSAGGVLGYGSRINDLRVDGLGRLWVLLRVLDPDWEAAVERTGPTFGAGPTVEILDYHGYWDSVIEVWDLARNEILASRRFSEFFIGFLESGEVVSYRVSEAEGARIDLTRICMELEISRIERS